MNSVGSCSDFSDGDGGGSGTCSSSYCEDDEEEDEEQLQEPDKPRAYFLKAMASRGVRVEALRFDNPHSKIRCAALRFHAPPPPGAPTVQLYDKELLTLVFDSCSSTKPEDMRLRLGDLSARAANAQNVSGETMLMKVCRRALTSDESIVDLVSLFLARGADPLVCCDSGKNVLHDVFWAAKPPPERVLETLEFVVFRLLEATGDRAFVDLLTSADKHGYTPLDYVVPIKQPNWRKIIDAVVDSACRTHGQLMDDTTETVVCCVTSGTSSESEGDDEAMSIADQKSVLLESLDFECTPGLSIPEVLADLDEDDRLILRQLDLHQCSCLLSGVSPDSDDLIVAVSSAFSVETGYTAREVLGRNCRFLQGPGTSMFQVDSLRRALRTRTTICVKLWNYKKNGEKFLNEFLLTPLRRKSHPNAVVYFIGIQSCPPAIIADRRRRLALRHKREDSKTCDDETLWWGVSDDNAPAGSSRDVNSTDDDKSNDSRHEMKKQEESEEEELPFRKKARVPAPVNIIAPDTAPVSRRLQNKYLLHGDHPIVSSASSSSFSSSESASSSSPEQRPSSPSSSVSSSSSSSSKLVTAPLTTEEDDPDSAVSWTRNLFLKKEQQQQTTTTTCGLDSELPSTI